MYFGVGTPFILEIEKGVISRSVSTFNGFVALDMFFEIRHRSNTYPILVSGSMRVGVFRSFISSSVASSSNEFNSLVP